MVKQYVWRAMIIVILPLILIAQGENWIYTYCGSESKTDITDIGWSITYGADGNIYAAGYSYNMYTGYDLTVISLPANFSVKENNNVVLKKSFSATLFSGPLRLPKNKTCRVFDITGRSVTPDRLKPGVYFIEVDGKIAQKVIKVK